MSTPHDLHQFLREVETGLPQWTRRVLDEAVPRLATLTRVERRDVIAAEEALRGADGTAMRLAWVGELTTALLHTPSAEPQHADHEDISADTGLAGLAHLSLKGEAEVDEDIELSHLVQDTDMKCDAVLRDLRGLWSALRGWPEVRPDAPPLRPQAVADALARALRSQPFTPAVRLVLIKALVPATAEVLPDVLQAQLKHLKAAGVEPADFKVVASPDTGFATGMGAWSNATTQAAAMGAQLGRIHAVVERLLADAGYAGEDNSPPSGHMSDAWMHGVVQAAVQDAAPPPRLRQVFDQMSEPGMRLARTEPDLWHQPEHVWWQLLEMLMLLCAEPAGAADGVARGCEAAVQRFFTEGPPDAALCGEVLADVKRVQQQAGRPAAAAAGRGAPANDGDGGDDGEAQADAGEASDDAVDETATFNLNRMVREQMSQQLRSTRASGSIRRFLMGPWLRVLVAALDPHEGQPALAQRYTDWVDALLGGLRNSPTADELASLLDIAREGLGTIGLADAQIDTWLFDLTMRLHERGAEEAEAAQTPWKHDELPTVPVDLHGSVQGARARRDKVAWIRSLCVGDICRVYLDNEWCNLQLVVDPRAEGAPEGGVYQFLHRGTKEELTLTRADLERLRGDGLATTVATATIVARSQDTMAARLDEALPGGKR